MVKGMWLGLLAWVAVAGADVLHHEGFSDGTADLAWVSTWGPEADQVAVDWMNGNPSGDGFIGTLGNGLSGGGVGTAVVAAPELADYQVSAQLYLVPGSAHYRGIVGRATDFSTDTTSSWGFYMLVADLSQNTGMGDERVMLRKWTPGAGMATNIKIWSRAELGDLYPASEGWHNLGMAFEGNQITCSINGQTLPNGTWTDDTFSAGGFGVYLWNMADTTTPLRFDDVLVETETALATPAARPGTLELGAPWPNPFNPTVRVPLALAQAAPVDVRVVDLAGRLVKVLHSGTLPGGSHELSWNGEDRAGRSAASGLYLLQVDSPAGRRSAKLTLLR